MVARGIQMQATCSGRRHKLQDLDADEMTHAFGGVQWEEWGCPKDKEYYEYMKGYSPVDNIQRAAYPNILVTAGARRLSLGAF